MKIIIFKGDNDKVDLLLRMYGTYISNRKFHSIRISVTFRYNKNLQKINNIKDTKNI